MSVTPRCRCCGSSVAGGKATFVCPVCRPTVTRHLAGCIVPVPDIQERIEYYAARAHLRLPLFDDSPYKRGVAG